MDGGDSEVFERLRPTCTTTGSSADSREEVTPAPYEEEVPWMDGDGIWDCGGETESVRESGDRSDFSL